MAIKKGAFEQYTQERKLPEKSYNAQTKKSHFFDDSYEQNNGSQSVHNQNVTEIQGNEKREETNNQEIFNESIGSQMVHKRFIVKFPDQDKVQALSHNKVHDKEFIGSQLVHNHPELSESLISSQESYSSFDNLNSSDSISFFRLVGIQREIIIALYKNMRANKTHTTEALNLEMISTLSGVNQKSLKNTLFRLTSIGCISRADQKNGRGGWVKYKIHDKIINEIQQSDFLITTKNK